MGKKQKKKMNARKREAQKAQNKVAVRPLNQQPEHKEKQTSSHQQKVNPTHTLPINEIKKDLRRTTIFAICSIAVLLTLHFTNTSYIEVLEFLRKI